MKRSLIHKKEAEESPTLGTKKSGRFQPFNNLKKFKFKISYGHFCEDTLNFQFRKQYSQFDSTAHIYCQRYLRRSSDYNIHLIQQVPLVALYAIATSEV